MPAPTTASSTPLAPNGAKPPDPLLGLALMPVGPGAPMLQFPVCHLNSRTTMASTGMMSFHHMIPLLILESQPMPKKLMNVKLASSTTVMNKPSPVGTPVVGLKIAGHQ